MGFAPLKVTDVPENVAQKLNVPVATVGEVTLNEVKGGYTQISVPLLFEDAQGAERKFTARFNVREEWFDSSYRAPKVTEEDKGTPEYAEAKSYEINMQRNVRGLFAAAGLDEIDFDQIEGSTVGFTAGPNSKDKSRLDLKSFYKPRA
jgi:hypothetical protein